MSYYKNYHKDTATTFNNQLNKRDFRDLVHNQKWLPVKHVLVAVSL